MTDLSELRIRNTRLLVEIFVVASGQRPDLETAFTALNHYYTLS